MKRQGFTLIELLVVIAIIGILSTLAIVALGSARQKARDSKRVADINQISKALELYYSENNSYPTIITPGQALRSPDGSVTYLSAVPQNPSPKNDGACPGKEYAYGYSTQTNAYALETCLGFAVGAVGGGSVILSPDGLSGGLVQYYTFEEGSGTTVNDRVGTKNGTWFGGGAHYNATAKFGSYAGSFNGSTDYVNLPTGSYTNSTVSVWVYRTSVAGMLENIFSGGGACQYPALRSLTVQNFYGAPINWQTGYTAPTINTWNHIAMTFAGTTGEYKIFVNGIREQSGSGSSYNNCSITSIGAIAAGNDRFFAGYIDDFRVYSRVLTEAEVVALYRGGS